MTDVRKLDAVEVCNAALMEVGIAPTARWWNGTPAIYDRESDPVLLSRALTLAMLATGGPSGLIPCFEHQSTFHPDREHCTLLPAIVALRGGPCDYARDKAENANSRQALHVSGGRDGAPGGDSGVAGVATR